jgi:hypothetical protein
MRQLLRTLHWLPVVTGLATTVLATVVTTVVLTGGGTDRQLLEWTSYLLTGFVITLFLDYLSVRGTMAKRAKAVDSDSPPVLSAVPVLHSGITDVALGERRVDRKLELIRSAQRDVLSVGIAMSNVCSEECLPNWSDVLRRSRVRIMLIDPEWLEAQRAVLEALCRHLMREPQILLAQAATSLTNLSELAASLPARQRARLHVRTYSSFPTLNMLLLDQNSPQSQLFVELLPYRCGFRGRPHFLLRPSDLGLYSRLTEMAEALWDEGTSKLTS